ncbi:MAG: hypothetical protein N5P05_002387 [Chroococcopsis gigantea SAG 12.99]|jgi:ABC-type uncharacterized transport system involved in gliding motility auxiliary subunit|nr:Gldg family protein [Chlorogloea purpurea SAG 13.99]MDV3000781.1 hypothetical protein [Chroococcopsis gigantea SAG 12.99]
MKPQLFTKYLYIPGLFLVTAAIVAGLISQQWTTLYLALFLSGIVCLIAWLIFSFPGLNKFWQRRSTKASTEALIATAAVLTILGFINFLSVQYPIRKDFTENALFSLSPQTERLLQNLQQPVKVIIFSKEGNINPLDQEVIDNYKRKSPNFTYQFIDPDKQPGSVKDFKNKSGGKLYRVYLQSGEKTQPLTTLGEQESLTEAKLTNAIATLQNNQVLSAYFLQGHGEHSLQSGQGGMIQAVNSLTEKGYKIEPLNLVETSTIPPDAATIVVAGPKRKLFPQEVAALKKYSEEGGNLLLMIDPETDVGLEPLLESWGVKLDRRLVIDGSGAGNLIGLGPATPIITNYGKHPITQDFGNGISLYPYSRPVGTSKMNDVEGVSLLIANEKMWAESNITGQSVEFDPKTDLPGPFDIGVALTRKLPSDKTAKLVVIGNSSFATDGLFEQQLNGDVFLNSVQWLSTGQEQTLSIRPKQAQNRRLNLTPLQANSIFWLSIVVIPLVSFIGAGVTWWRRSR